MPQKGQFTSHRVVDGIERKFCNSCGRWLTLDSFHPKSHRRGYYHPCKSCRGPGPSPLLRFKPEYYKFLRLVVNRVGKAEAARLIGVEKSRISTLTGARAPIRIQRATAKAILEVYMKLTELDIVISRDAIKHGAFERGKDAVRPQDGSEFYQRDGDRETMRRRHARLHRRSE